MISERAFAEGYSTYWKHLLPGGGRYVRFINGSASQRVDAEVDAKSRAEVRSIVSQAAFYLAQKLCESVDLRTKGENALLDTDEWVQSLHSSQQFISRFSKRPESLDLLQSEQREAVLLAKAITRHLTNSPGHPLFSPKFPGWGLLSSARGDVLKADCLIEVKAVEGAFGIGDIRQILIYGTLNFLSKTHQDMHSFELYNPRLGKSYTDTFEDISQGIAGCSAEELFTEIGRRITDVQSSI